MPKETPGYWVELNGGNGPVLYEIRFQLTPGGTNHSVSYDEFAVFERDERVHPATGPLSLIDGEDGPTAIVQLIRYGILRHRRLGGEPGSPESCHLVLQAVLSQIPLDDMREVRRRLNTGSNSASPEILSVFTQAQEELAGTRAREKQAAAKLDEPLPGKPQAFPVEEPLESPDRLTRRREPRRSVQMPGWAQEPSGTERPSRDL